MAQRTANAHQLTGLLRHNRPVAREITLKRKPEYRHEHGGELWEEFLDYMEAEHGQGARTWAFWTASDPMDEAGSIMATFVNWMLFFRQVLVSCELSPLMPLVPLPLLMHEVCFALVSGKMKQSSGTMWYLMCWCPLSIMSEQLSRS
jgi:hypothetical protein